MPQRGSRHVFSNSTVRLEIQLVFVSYGTNLPYQIRRPPENLSSPLLTVSTHQKARIVSTWNVYAPSNVPPLGGYPVMFWIYGGSLQFGDAGQPVYDGSSFAAFEDVIVVTTSYRTNGMDSRCHKAVHWLTLIVFGFPNSPELPLTRQNLGFLDQRFALEWVQYSIRSFGGNPQKVTIFGESAGALSVDALVTSYSHNPPFRAAIEESGEVFLEDFLNAGLNSTKSWLTLAASLNCYQSTSNLVCVRTANATTIKSIIEHAALGFQPMVDNITLIGNPAAARAAHNAAHVPMLVGTNGQEGRIFVIGQSNLSSYINNTFDVLPSVASQVAQAYAVGTGGLNTYYEAIAQIYTELVFQCPQAITANESAAAGYPTWRYIFNASFANTQIIPNLAAFHSSEVPIVFGTYPQANATAQESALSQYIRGAWGRFAKNSMGGPGCNAIGTFAGMDLGLLGTNGTSGVTVIKGSDVDGRCEIFTPLYHLLGGWDTSQYSDEQAKFCLIWYWVLLDMTSEIKKSSLPNIIHLLPLLFFITVLAIWCKYPHTLWCAGYALRKGVLY